MRATLPPFFFAALALGCGGSPSYSDPNAKPDPRGAVAAPKKGEYVQPGAINPAPSPRPRPSAPKPEPPAPTFEADWKTAEAIVAKRCEGWEARAEKAKRLLTNLELPEVEQLIGAAKATPENMGNGVAERMNRYGMGDAVRCIGSQWAMSTRQFRAVAKVMWMPKTGAEGIASQAERWGSLGLVERGLVVQFAKEGTRATDLIPTARDAIIEAGGGEWLAR